MVCCSAPNCSNSSRKGVKLFRFPSDPKRRAVWLINCRRDKWKPSTTSRLCEVHFTEEQFESRRQDGRKLLKRTAIPTVFRFPHLSRAPAFSRAPPKSRVLEEAIIDGQHNGPTDPENIPCDEGELVEEAGDDDSQQDEVSRLKKEIRRLQAKVLKLTKDKEEMQRKLEHLFEPDQMLNLENKGSSNPYPWSEKTVKKALQIRAATGQKGYAYLCNIGFPLPSYRTLCRRIEASSFAPGLQRDIIHWLGVKLAKEANYSKNCVLCIDEMQLRPTLEYDKGLKTFIGTISPEICREGEEDVCHLATHALAFVVRGLALHWKQVVGYFLTGESIEAPKLWAAIKEIVILLGNCGMNVVCVSSDMGPNNTRLWGYLGIHSTKFQVSNSVPHPASNGKLYFMPDVPHLLKNVRNSLLSNEIQLPEYVVREHHLFTDTVTLDHVRKIIELQEGRGLKLTPKLTLAHVTPSKFQKMRVEHASSVLSHTTASALQFFVAEELIPQEALSTAWFLQQMNSWFDLMNSRVKFDALGKDNAETKLSAMEDFVTMIKGLTFNRKIQWKPIQTGIQLATKTVMALHNDLVVNGDMEYLLTSRLTTDCVENLFSQIRGQGDMHPTPTKLRHSIKLISVSQYLHVPKYSSYLCDDDEYYIDFLKRKPELPEDLDVGDSVELPVEEDWYDIIDENVMYYVCGWAVFAVLKHLECDACTDAIKSPLPLENLAHGWTSIVEKRNLCHPTASILQILTHVESLFRSSVGIIVHQRNAQLYLLEVTKKLWEESVVGFPTCHSVLDLVIKKYLSLRLHIHGHEVTKALKPSVSYGSKSAYMQSVSRV